MAMSVKMPKARRSPRKCKRTKGNAGADVVNVNFSSSNSFASTVYCNRILRRLALISALLAGFVIAIEFIQQFFLIVIRPFVAFR